MELEHFRQCPHPNEAALGARLADLERMRELVRAANEPSVLDAEPAAALRDIAQRTFERRGRQTDAVSDAGRAPLPQIPHGTLDDVERREIQSHAEQTYQFLSKIPWTDDLKNLSAYAYGHHEMLNGSGYPRHLAGREIALQTRIITLADIFDALTASDRPYKPAVSVEKALAIIESEAKAGRLDADLVRVMMDSRVFADAETDGRPAS